MRVWHRAILRIASLAVPADIRSDWLRTWTSELWYVPPCDATAFCLGAAGDVALLWRDNPAARFDSPILYLIALFVCSAAVFLIGFAAARSKFSFPSGPHAANEWPTAIFLFLLLMGIGAVVGRRGKSRPTGLRDGIFLLAKLALAVPLFYGALFVAIALHGPVLLPMVIFVLAARSMFADQLRRCPHCLRSLHSPVAIGHPSETFLQWYGTESVCMRCRALMQMPDTIARYSAEARCLQLDASWNDVFAATTDVAAGKAKLAP